MLLCIFSARPLTPSGDGLKVLRSVNHIYKKITGLISAHKCQYSPVSLICFCFVFQRKHTSGAWQPKYKMKYGDCNRSGYFMVIKPFCYDQGSQNYSLHWFFFPLLQLISTNKVPLRVNTLYQTLEAITIPSPTIVPLKFNQCKLHVANYLIFCMLLLEQ